MWIVYLTCNMLWYRVFETVLSSKIGNPAMILIHTIQDQTHDGWVQEIIRSNSFSTSCLIPQPFKIKQASSMKMMCSFQLFLRFQIRTRSSESIYFVASVTSSCTETTDNSNTKYYKHYRYINILPGISHQGRFIKRGKTVTQRFENTDSCTGTRFCRIICSLYCV